MSYSPLSPQPPSSDQHCLGRGKRLHAHDVILWQSSLLKILNIVVCTHLAAILLVPVLMPCSSSLYSSRRHRTFIAVWRSLRCVRRRSSSEPFSCPLFLSPLGTSTMESTPRSYGRGSSDPRIVSP
jgi:hypothetical protein